MESRWKRKELSRRSSVLCVMRLPRSLRKSMPSLLIAATVSDATGTNKYDWASDEYLFVFLSAAAFAAAPGVWDVSCKYYRASVSLTVTSHVTHFPCFHGRSVTPSGRFPSVIIIIISYYPYYRSHFTLSVHCRFVLYSFLCYIYITPIGVGLLAFLSESHSDVGQIIKK